MYDKNICGKEIVILGTLSNSKDSDEMLHNVAFIIKVFMVSKDKIPLTERYTWTSLQENDNMWPPSLHAMDSPKYTFSNQKEGSIWYTLHCLKRKLCICFVWRCMWSVYYCTFYTDFREIIEQNRTDYLFDVIYIVSSQSNTIKNLHIKVTNTIKILKSSCSAYLDDHVLTHICQ